MTAKKPAALRLLEGNPGRRPIKPEIQGKGRPVKPEGLNDLQIKMWDRIVSSFPDGYLTQADELTIERLIRTWTLYRKCCDALQNDERILYKDSHGKITKNPYYGVLRSLEQTLDRLTKELGLSPLSRSRIAISEAEPVEPIGPYSEAFDQRQPARLGARGEQRELKIHPLPIDSVILRPARPPT